MADASSFQEHISSTNSRLASIRLNLADASTFPQACDELTKWCSDQRAFTAHFEENLMLALQVAMENGSKENYDFNLTHTLVSACFTHRKHLSKPSATQIGRWYEQMRRLKKNGGKRKRAPPKSKDLPPAPPPLITSPAPPLSLPPNGTENNTFMFSPSSDGSMWPQGPIGAPPPGSSGHLTPGAPFPGPMAPHPGMYPSGQMSLPYGQMEGNHAMYDQRMMAARAAGRPGMMAPEYPTMPGIAQNPGAQQMMMNRMAYPPGHPQMAGPPMQYGQMMRAPPVSVYGQMNQPQPYPVTAHPNPTPAPISPELRQIYETCHAYTTLRPVVEESEVPVGSMGIEAMILPDALHQLESSNDSDFLLTVWPISKGHDHIQFSIYFNQQLVVTNASENKCVSIKSLVKSGINMFHFVYNSHEKYHRFCCEFVTKKPLIDLRKISMSKKPGDFNSLVQQSKVGYIQMAQRRQAGFVNTSILCSLTKKRMFTPARHTDCKKALFEFGNMINMNKDKNRYYCAQCGNTFKFEDIIIDFFMMQVISHMPSNVTDVIIDKAGGFRPAEAEKDEQKPKRGKKKNDDGNANSIKRIKSETFVKQEPGMFGDMHNRGIPYSPMPMPGSVPPDWSRLQSPSFSMHSPNKIQLGPATPATPGLVYQNPASAGSMLNMSSPRQTMLPAPAQHHAVIGAPQEQVSTAVASGSAPYTPESVMSDHDMGFGHINDDLALIGKPLFVDREDVLSHLLIDTNSSTLREFDTSDYDDELSHIREPLKRLLAPSSSSSTSTTFTPPFDDIHLGSRPSH